MDTVSRPRFTGIAWRLGAGFGGLLLLLLTVSAAALLQLRTLGNTMEEVLDRDVRVGQLVLQLEVEVGAISADLRQSILADSGDQIAASLKLALEGRERLVKTQETLVAAMNDASGQQALKAVAEALPGYLAVLDGAAKAVKSGDPDEARNTLTAAASVKARRALTGALRALATSSEAHIAEARASGVATRARAQWIVGGLALCAGLLAAAVGWLLTRSIVVPAREAIEVAQRIAEGRLSQDITNRRRDEMGQLLDAMQGMQLSLRTLVGNVRQAADSIQVATGELAAGNTDLSSRTEQTASQLQETASSMEQLSGTVRQSAEAASQASQLASGAAQVARQGGEVVSQVVTTMEDINASSKKIADIVGVIDGIAFQTNILALNAAVEAARAGEQGRGFAVVASEVRALAGRSADAAREIKALIGGSVDRVEAGSRLVTDAGATMNEIVARVQRVSDIISEISAAAAEQNTGIGQVNSAVNDLDRMTQQNAALVEQATAASGSMTEQAARLVESVRAFSIAEHA